MEPVYFAYPGDLDTPTGGYGYDRKIIAGLRDLGWRVEPIALGDGFPFPSERTLQDAQKRLAALPADAFLVVDGLAFGAMPDIAKASGQRLKLVALVHHPLCRENGLTPDRAQALEASETRALSFAHHVIVTSPATADQVCAIFGVSPDRVTVIVPGTDKQDTIDREPAARVNLLSVGTLVPRKGYDLLFTALAGLLDAQWRLDVVGGTSADPDCFSALQKQALELGLSDRIVFHGAVVPDALARYYQSADVFVLASRYEGYGMAYTEALAHGLPVIGSGGGAVRDTLPEGAALYCGTEDVPALQAALKELISDPSRRADMARAAKAAAEQLPDWRDTSNLFATTLQRIGK